MDQFIRCFEIEYRLAMESLRTLRSAARGCEPEKWKDLIRAIMQLERCRMLLDGEANRLSGEHDEDANKDW